MNESGIDDCIAAVLVSKCGMTMIAHEWRKVLLSLLVPVLVATNVLMAEDEETEKDSTVPEPPLPVAQREAMLSHYRELATNLTERLKQTPEVIALYSRRGDCHMFLGKFKKSEADYAKMIELDQELFAPHWRLGIAYYYTGKFEMSAKQFEAYDTYNDRDRENGIWQYMARVNLVGLEKARETMLVYEEFDREPFPQLYAMFEGKDASGGDELLKEIKDAEGISEKERQRRLFFANLYVGIYKELSGDKEAALILLREAAASKWGQQATGGPTYMWQIARLHYDRLLQSVSKTSTDKSDHQPSDGN